MCVPSGALRGREPRRPRWFQRQCGFELRIESAQRPPQHRCAQQRPGQPPRERQVLGQSCPEHLPGQPSTVRPVTSGRTMPALSTNASMGVSPNRSRTDVAKARTESSSVKSTGIASPTDVGRRAPRISRTLPDSVSRSAAIAPNPDVPPVITIVDTCPLGGRRTETTQPYPRTTAVLAAAD